MVELSGSWSRRMLVLTAQQLIGLLPRTAVIDAVETALRALHAGSVVLPERQHVDCNTMTLLTMPAATPACIGIKLVSVAPGNAAAGLPVVNGCMLLLDGGTGLPTALLDAAALTAQRTGAIGALGVKYTTPADVDSAGVIGVGVQAAWQAIYAAAVRPLNTLYYVPRAREPTQRFEACVRHFAPELKLAPCADVHQLLRCTSVIVAATTSPTPVLPDAPAILEGKHFISVGSFKQSMQELPDAVYRLAGFIALDSDQARQEVGDVAGPLARGIVAADRVFHMADVVTGSRVIDVARTTVFKSVGAALYDLFAAQAYLAAARRLGIGTEVAL